MREEQDQNIETQGTPAATPPANCKGGANYINTHFTLSIIAICLSCFTGFFSIPMAIAALILSLRAQDLINQKQPEEAKRISFWAALFGWITVAIAIIPILLIIFFGGIFLTMLTAVLATP